MGDLKYLASNNFTVAKKNSEENRFNFVLKELLSIDMNTNEFLLLVQLLKTKQVDFLSEKKDYLSSLTSKELEVFTCICDGMVPKEISKKLFIEVSTAQTHRKNIIRKLKIKSFKDWCLYASLYNLNLLLGKA